MDHNSEVTGAGVQGRHVMFLNTGLKQGQLPLFCCSLKDGFFWKRNGCVGRAHPIAALSIIIKVIKSLRDQPAHPCRVNPLLFTRQSCKLCSLSFILLNICLTRKAKQSRVNTPKVNVEWPLSVIYPLPAAAAVGRASGTWKWSYNSFEMLVTGRTWKDFGWQESGGCSTIPDLPFPMSDLIRLQVKRRWDLFSVLFHCH